MRRWKSSEDDGVQQFVEPLWPVPRWRFGRWLGAALWVLALPLLILGLPVLRLLLVLLGLAGGLIAVGGVLGFAQSIDGQSRLEPFVLAYLGAALLGGTVWLRAKLRTWFW